MGNTMQEWVFNGNQQEKASNMARSTYRKGISAIGRGWVDVKVMITLEAFSSLFFKKNCLSVTFFKNLLENQNNAMNNEYLGCVVSFE